MQHSTWNAKYYYVVSSGPGMRQQVGIDHFSIFASQEFIKAMSTQSYRPKSCKIDRANS